MVSTRFYDYIQLLCGAYDSTAGIVSFVSVDGLRFTTTDL